MRRWGKVISLVSAASAAIVGLSAPPSAAQRAVPPPWMVSAGTAPLGSIVGFKASTQTPTLQLQVTDVASAQQVTCSASRLGGRALVTNSNSTGVNLFHVVGPTFGAANCVLGSSSIVLTPTGTGTWGFKGGTYVGGNTYGRLNNIDISWSGGGCSFTTQGFVRTRFFDNNPNPYFTTYAVGTGLVINSAVGCPGLTSGDQATLVVTYQLLPGSPSNSPLQIN